MPHKNTENFDRPSKKVSFKNDPKNTCEWPIPPPPLPSPTNSNFFPNTPPPPPPPPKHTHTQKINK